MAVTGQACKLRTDPLYAVHRLSPCDTAGRKPVHTHTHPGFVGAAPGQRRRRRRDGPDGRVRGTERQAQEGHRAGPARLLRTVGLLRGPHLVWNFLRACARGRALGCRMDALRVARTSFRARISAVQLLAVLGVDASVSSVLRLARTPCICRLEVCAACARVHVTVSGERLSLGSLRGVCPCSLHRQWRASIAWVSARRAPVFASPSTTSGESRSLWSLCGRHRAAVLLQKVNTNCAACELKLSRVWRAYAADGMRNAG